MAGKIKNSTGIKISDDPENPIAAEVIAQAIVDIADAMRKLNATRLTRKAIVVLIQAQSKLSKNTIEIVLNNLDFLEQTYLKKRGT